MTLTTLSKILSPFLDMDSNARLVIDAAAGTDAVVAAPMSDDVVEPTVSIAHTIGVAIDSTCQKCGFTLTSASATHAE